MITRLRLKNWRSLRDVTIDDLQPINVFIGANASGKTNILDALYFTREMLEKGSIQAVYTRGGGDNIRSLGAEFNEPVEIHLTCQLPQSGHTPITWYARTVFSKERYRFGVRQVMLEDGQPLFDDGIEKPAIPGNLDLDSPPFVGNQEDRTRAGLIWNNFFRFVLLHWQMLDENFMPVLGRETSQRDNLSVINRGADNLVFMLDYMREAKPDIYNLLQDDVRFLLEHVKQIRIERDEHEARLLVDEAFHPNKTAPTVSSGTARIFAMLAAYYALDENLVNLPGLVVIEEPDTALNPGILKNFVELLREYVDRPEPRQFILTTHNPAFLNYFRPEEVRVVSRDEQGYTTVSRVPDYIKDIWLHEHGLGEVWLTNAFGGVAE